MGLTRRDCLRLGAASMLSAAFSRARVVSAAPWARFKVGVTDWNLRLTGKTEAVALAKKLGFDGVQVSLGRDPVDKLPLADPAVQQSYLAESKRVDLPLASVCLDVLHRNYLKSDPLGPRRVADAIPIARALGVHVILLPFFGKAR